MLAGKKLCLRNEFVASINVESLFASGPSLWRKLAGNYMANSSRGQFPKHFQSLQLGDRTLSVSDAVNAMLSNRLTVPSDNFIVPNVVQRSHSAGHSPSPAYLQLEDDEYAPPGAPSPPSYEEVTSSTW